MAAAIGFGTSISGVAGGLSAVTSGPNAVPASARGTTSKLNHAVVALASRQTSTARSTGSTPSGSRTGGGGGSSNTPTNDAAGTGTPSNTGSAPTNSSGGSGGGPSVPTVNTPTTPDITLPGTGGGGTGGGTDAVNGAVNNVIGGVNNTVNGLLGR